MRPTRAMLEQNKKEVASRHEASMVSSLLGNLEKHPDVAKAARVGEPTMVDPEPMTATEVVRKISNSVSSGDNKVTVETTNGTVTPNQEAPRSDAPTAAADPASAELKPTVADPNELKPNVETDPNALPPLQQSNQLDNNGVSSGALSSTASVKSEEMADISSTKKKKKKGLGKLKPF